MKAKINKANIRSGKNYGSQKEVVNTLQVVASYKGKLYNPVKVVLWMGRSNQASVVYCSIWIHSRHKKVDCSGYGTAGGYGYHKESAALDSAIRSAGIKLDRYIDGAGENAMKDAVEAIARAAGFTGQMIVV
jgi:hypothetical protein